MRASIRSGFTMVEMVIAIAILTIIMTSAITATNTGNMAFRRSMSNGIVDSHACRALNRIVRELNGAGMNSIFPVRRAPDSTETISVQEVNGWAGGESTWSSAYEIRLVYSNGELDNGLDDNGDGFVDECSVVLIEDEGTATERRVTIVNHIQEFLEGELPNGIDDNGNGLEDERGLSFVLDGDELIVRITVMGRGPENVLILRTLETSVAVRN